MTAPLRIAISGAAGQIGYSLTFRVAAGAMFGQSQPVALHLLEAAGRIDALRALEMELTDCSFPLLSEIRIGTDPRQVFAGADWVLLLGGAPRWGEGQSRLDLLKQNGPIFIEHGRAINEACCTARVLVVANPPNTLCTIARSHAQDVPDEHWFALNRLERMRATALVAEKAGVPVSQVTRLTVWGNRSPKCFPDFRNCFINDRPAGEVIRDERWVREVLEPSVGKRSLEIIKLRGASPAGTAAQAILGTVHSICTPTPFERRFGASVVSDGSYQVPRGLVFGFPLSTPDGKSWSIIQGLYLDDHAQECLRANVAELEHDLAVAQEFLGVER